MIYTQHLPHLNNLQRLAKQIQDFPITGLGVVQYAKHLGCDEEIINFFKLFSQKIVFKSRSDLLNRCNLLEKMLNEERQAPPEHLKSPQD